jgi:hypothetical protein
MLKGITNKSKLTTVPTKIPRDRLPLPLWIFLVLIDSSCVRSLARQLFYPYPNLPNLQHAIISQF